MESFVVLKNTRIYVFKKASYGSTYGVLNLRKFSIIRRGQFKYTQLLTCILGWSLFVVKIFDFNHRPYQKFPIPAKTFFVKYFCNILMFRGCSSHLKFLTLKCKGNIKASDIL